MQPMKFGGGQENDSSSAVSERSVPSVWNNIGSLTMGGDLIETDQPGVIDIVIIAEPVLAEARRRSPTPVLLSSEPGWNSRNVSAPEVGDKGSPQGDLRFPSSALEVTRGRRKRRRRLEVSDRSPTPVIESSRRITTHFQQTKRASRQIKKTQMADTTTNVTMSSHMVSSIGSSAQRGMTGPVTSPAGSSPCTSPSNIDAKTSAVSTKTSTGS